MLNVKDQIYVVLCTVLENVSDTYPSDWASMPVIQYQEEDNKVVEYTDMEEQKAYCRYKIDIWNGSGKSTSELAINVDKAMSGLGLKRIQCMDVDDPNGYKHKLMRYEMTIDVNTQVVYHND